MAGGTEGERLLRVEEPHRGMRLDAFVAGALGIGRRAAVRVIAGARVNGRRASKGHPLLPGDEVRIVLPSAPGPEPALLRVEAEVVVLDKPAGLPTVALTGDDRPSAAAWLARRHPECAGVGGAGEAGLVHRLDTGTSGLLLAARSPAAYEALRRQFQLHTIEKAYRAVVAGRVAEELTIDAPIGQHRKSRTRVRALPEGDHPRYAVTPARTLVTPLRDLGPATLVEARTHTGARHQVRVHLAHAGHPLVGDVQYGGPEIEGVRGYLLHASELTWRDPASDEIHRERLETPARWEDVAATGTGAPQRGGE